jgi:hypothetical protein
MGAIALLSLMAFAGVSGAPETFTGVITDSECAAGSHAAMRMGNTDAECTTACVEAHGASYVLDNGNTRYGLTDQRMPRAFAGRRVTVTGMLDADGRTITVSSIAVVRE